MSNDVYDYLVTNYPKEEYLKNPSLREREFMAFLDYFFPGKWEYIGNKHPDFLFTKEQGETRTCANPDYVCRAKRLFIELEFNRSGSKHLREKMELYKSLGYRAIIIRGISLCLDPVKGLEIIRAFMKGGDNNG